MKQKTKDNLYKAIAGILIALFSYIDTHMIMRQKNFNTDLSSRVGVIEVQLDNINDWLQYNCELTSRDENGHS